jgi:Fe-S cluster assembly iron-binding protein IscA
MNAKVTHNEDGERVRLSVDSSHKHGLSANFSMQGSTAVCTTVTPTNEDSVYADDFQAVLDYVESLPFVQAVTLDEYSEEQA